MGPVECHEPEITGLEKFSGSLVPSRATCFLWVFISGCPVNFCCCPNRNNCWKMIPTQIVWCPVGHALSYILLIFVAQVIRQGACGHSGMWFFEPCIWDFKHFHFHDILILFVIFSSYLWFFLFRSWIKMQRYTGQTASISYYDPKACNRFLSFGQSIAKLTDLMNFSSFANTLYKAETFSIIVYPWRLLI